MDLFSEEVLGPIIFVCFWLCMFFLLKKRKSSNKRVKFLRLLIFVYIVFFFLCIEFHNKIPLDNSTQAYLLVFISVVFFFYYIKKFKELFRK